MSKFLSRQLHASLVNESPISIEGVPQSDVRGIDDVYSADG